MDVLSSVALRSGTENSTDTDHTIASFCGHADGPTLIAVGSLHGNEPSGSKALRTLVGALRSIESRLCGRVYFIEGNIRALRANARFLDADLNRHWTPRNISLSETGRTHPSVEDLELNELLTIFREILDSAKDEVYVLDLHSTSAHGKPFATVGDTLRNRHFARKFPVTILLGIEEQLEGTMLEYLNNQGVVTMGFEAGQHDRPESVANHVAFVVHALVNSGIADKEDFPNFESLRRDLESACGGGRFVEVLHREAITPEDEFSMYPGYENFEPVTRGQLLAKNRRGEVRSPMNGLILMPLYQKKGDDGFFIGREVAVFWIRLSGVLRKLKLATFVRILPGVMRHPTDPDSLVVNTSVARFFPLQIFHLLGYRKMAWTAKQLVVSRRKFDTRSPFQG